MRFASLALWTVCKNAHERTDAYAGCGRPTLNCIERFELGSFRSDTAVTEGFKVLRFCLPLNLPREVLDLRTGRCHLFTSYIFLTFTLNFTGSHCSVFLLISAEFCAQLLK